MGLIYKVSRVKIDDDPHIVFIEVESKLSTGMYINTQKENVRYRLITLTLPKLKVMYNDDAGDYISYRRLYNKFKKEKNCVVLKVDNQGRIIEGFCKTYRVCIVTEESNLLIYNKVMETDKF